MQTQPVTEKPSAPPVDRHPLAVAILFVVLVLAGSFAAAPPPGVSASGQEVVTWAQENSQALQWQAWLLMLSTFAGFVLVALVVRHLGGTEGIVFLMGGLLSVILVAVAAMIRLGLAADHGLGPEAAGVLGAVQDYWGPLATFPIAIQGLATFSGSRRGALGPVVGGLGLLLTVEQLAETSTIFGRDGFLSPGGGMNAYVGPVLYATWSIALGVALQRALRASEAAGPGAA